MKKYAFLVLGLMLLLFGSANSAGAATDNGLGQSATLSADCGEVTITVTNTSKWLFEWGVNVVGEGQVETLLVDGRILDGPDSASYTHKLPEGGTVTYGNTAGAENEWYLAFQTIMVPACEVETPPATSTTTTGPATTTTEPGEGTDENTTTTVPTTTTSGATVSYANCAEAGRQLFLGDPGYSRDLDADGDGVACESFVPTTTTDNNIQPAGNTKDPQDLAYTGTDGSSVGLLLGIGLVTVAAGVGAIVAMRRRSTS